MRQNVSDGVGQVHGAGQAGLFAPNAHYKRIDIGPGRRLVYTGSRRSEGEIHLISDCCSVRPVGGVGVYDRACLFCPNRIVQGVRLPCIIERGFFYA